MEWSDLLLYVYTLCSFNFLFHFCTNAALFGRNLQTHQCLQPKVGKVWTAGKGKPLPLVFIFITAKCSHWLALSVFFFLFPFKFLGVWFWFSLCFLLCLGFFCFLGFFSFQLGSEGDKRGNELRAEEKSVCCWAVSCGEEIRLKLERPGQT